MTMKNLKFYLESLLDDEDDIALDPRADIIVFIQNNYLFNNRTPGNPEESTWVIQTDGDIPIVHVNSSVKVKNTSIESLTNGLFKFGNIYGRFDCSNCSKLESLEGGPYKVAMSFICENCPKLKSLEGGPQYVGCASYDSSYICRDCTSLTSLKGAPIGNVNLRDNYASLEGVDRNSGKLYLHVDANNCKSIKTIDWNIKELRGNLYLRSCDLRDLNGSPRKVTGEFLIANNKNLTSLKGAPLKIGDEFYAGDCTALKDLTGCPMMANKNASTIYDFNGCTSLKDLKGAPDRIHKLKLDNCEKLEYLDELREVYYISCINCYSLKPYTVVPNPYKHGMYNSPEAHLSGSAFVGDIGKNFKQKGFRIKYE